MEKIVARNEEKCNQALKPQKEEIKWWNRGERKKKKKNFTIKRNRKKRKENTRVRDATEREKKQKILQFGERTGWKSSSQDNIFFLEKLVSKKQLLFGYRNCYERGTRVAMENRWWTSVNPPPSFSPRPPNPCHVPPRFTLVFEPVAAITGNSGVSSATIPTAIAIHRPSRYIMRSIRPANTFWQPAGSLSPCLSISSLHFTRLVSLTSFSFLSSLRYSL